MKHFVLHSSTVGMYISDVCVFQMSVFIRCLFNGCIAVLCVYFSTVCVFQYCVCISILCVYFSTVCISVLCVYFNTVCVFQ